MKGSPRRLSIIPLQLAEGFDRLIGVAGFSNVRVKNVDTFLGEIEEKFPGAIFQFLNAQFVAGPRHLVFATINALSAFKTGVNISRSLAVECLLYASAQNQIKRAMELIGIYPTTLEVALIVVNDDEESARKLLKGISGLVPGIRDDSTLELSETKSLQIKDLFGITEVELSTRHDADEKKALTDLVIEHCALLVCNR